MIGGAHTDYCDGGAHITGGSNSARKCESVIRVP
jgi:hypothetical protein